MPRVPGNVPATFIDRSSDAAVDVVRDSQM
jgi:hypothetical protein